MNPKNVELQSVLDRIADGNTRAERLNTVITRLDKVHTDANGAVNVIRSKAGRLAETKTGGVRVSHVVVLEKLDASNGVTIYKVGQVSTDHEPGAQAAGATTTVSFGVAVDNPPDVFATAPGTRQEGTLSGGLLVCEWPDEYEESTSDSTVQDILGIGGSGADLTDHQLRQAHRHLDSMLESIEYVVAAAENLDLNPPRRSDSTGGDG